MWTVWRVSVLEPRKRESESLLITQSWLNIGSLEEIKKKQFQLMNSYKNFNDKNVFADVLSHFWVGNCIINVFYVFWKYKLSKTLRGSVRQTKTVNQAHVKHTLSFSTPWRKHYKEKEIHQCLQNKFTVFIYKMLKIVHLLTKSF